MHNVQADEAKRRPEAPLPLNFAYGFGEDSFSLVFFFAYILVRHSFSVPLTLDEFRGDANPHGHFLCRLHGVR